MGAKLFKTTNQIDFQSILNATEAHKIWIKNWVPNYFNLFYETESLTYMDFDYTNLTTDMIISYVVNEIS